MAARGLCPTCYSRHYKFGSLNRFSTKSPGGPDTYNRWLELKEAGYNERAAAQLIGIKYGSLLKNIRRNEIKG